MQAQTAKELFDRKKIIAVENFLSKYAVDIDEGLRLFPQHRYTTVRFADGSVLHYLSDGKIVVYSEDEKP
jgi:hypothetical protein